MYIEQAVKAVSSQNNSKQFSQNKDEFRDVFQRVLNYKSNSRPPKIELTGILIPNQSLANRNQYRFKLETDRNEYLLSLSDTVSILAKKLEWEEVTVKGYLDPDDGVFEVETISISNRNEPYRLSLGPSDSFWDLDQFKKAIARKGILDVAPDYLAS